MYKLNDIVYMFVVAVLKYLDGAFTLIENDLVLPTLSRCNPHYYILPSPPWLLVKKEKKIRKGFGFGFRFPMLIIYLFLSIY